MIFMPLRRVVKEEMQRQTVDDLSWREFYSPELFAKIRKDLGYSSGDLDSTAGTPQQEAEERFGSLERDTHTDNPLDGRRTIRPPGQRQPAR